MISEQTKRKAVELYRQQDPRLSLSQIADQLGISQASVSSIVAASGVESRLGPVDPDRIAARQLRVEHLQQAATKRGARSSVKAQALEMYVTRRDLTTSVIAQSLEISPSTLTLWAQEAGLKLRDRGRRPMVSPTAYQIKIIEDAAFLTLDMLAKRYGMTKQNVHRILKRWSKWAEDKVRGFLPGDVIMFQGKHYTVIEGGKFVGKVQDEQGRVWRDFRWYVNGHLAKLVQREVENAQPVPD